jgi:response regulator RpfG family c-di-GMP phosphodiesterase
MGSEARQILSLVRIPISPLRREISMIRPGDSSNQESVAPYPSPMLDSYSRPGRCPDFDPFFSPSHRIRIKPSKMHFFRSIPKSLLIVEPDDEKRDLLVTYFKKGVECRCVAALEQAYEAISKQEFSVVIAPMMPPELGGLELIDRLEHISPDTVTILTSDTDTDGNTLKAFRAGAFDVVRMPTSLQKLDIAVERAFVQFEMRALRSQYHQHLENDVSLRTLELEQSLEEVERSYRMTLSTLIKALEARELETEGHTERMITFSLRLGFELGLENDALRDLELGTLLHDIGKINVPDDILRKPDRLDAAQWEIMKRHPVLGHDMVRDIPFLEGAGRIVAEHHECWDGSGYPNGLRGEQIAIGARILAVVDAFDAMISDRVYRKGRGYRPALAEIESFAGTQFDPLIVDAFRQVPEEDWEFLHERSLMDRPESQSYRSVVSELVFARRGLELVH